MPITGVILASGDYLMEVRREGMEPKTHAVVLKASAIPVAPPAATVCPGSSANFASTMAADETAAWFDAADGGNLIGVGSIFTTPETASTTPSESFRRRHHHPARNCNT